MTPFKFGKKQKSKEKDGVNTQGNGNGNDSTFSSPSSQNQNNSPNFSNNGGNGNSQFQQQNKYGHSPSGSSSNYGNSPAANSYTREPGVGLVYDQNNNYQTRSPQRQQQARGYNQVQQQQYQQSPSQQHSQLQHRDQPQALPQYGQPIPVQGAGATGTPPQRGSFKSPWNRSKLLISPFPRYRHAASSHANDKGEVFVMGGLHNTSVYGDTWILKPDVEGRQFQSFQVDIYDNSPAPRVGHASTLCGNAYVIFGGDTVTNDAGEIDNDLYLFNMNSHAWTVPRPVGKKPSGRYGHSIGVIAITNYDSKLYLYGGQLDDVVYNDLCVFNLSSFRRPDVHWEWVAPKDNIRPPPLTNHSMDVYDNKLWIFGGSTGKRLSNDLWSFDPQYERWDKIKTLGAQPLPVEEHASVVYKDLLILYGGKNSDGDAVNDLYILNLITKTWFKLPTNFPLEPQGKYGHTLSILKNDKLLILGGHLPDYANLGENLEVSSIDNGVGTILNVLDLSNLPKLVPGLQQYSTPNRTAQDRFPNQQSIFTPQKTPQQQNSPAPISKYTPGTGADSSHYGTTTAVGAGAAAIGAGAAATAIHNAQSGSITSDTQRPNFQKSQAGQYSAEEIFHRDQRNAPSQITPEKKNLLNVPQGQQQTFSSPEEELPLQLPSPIKTNESDVPGSFPSSARSATGDSYRDISESKETLGKGEELTGGIPGGFNDDFKTPNTSPSKTSLAANDDDYLAPQVYKNDEAKNSDFLDSYVNGTSTSDLLEKGEDEEIASQRQSIGKTEYGTGVPETLQQHKAIGKTEFGPGAAEAALNQGKTVGKTEFGTGDGTDSNNTQRIGKTELSAGALAAGAAGAVGAPAFNSGKTRDLNTVVDNGAYTSEEYTSSGKGVPSSNGSSDNNEVKKIIASLSKELEDLKLSTNAQIKEASSKVKELEEENTSLKQQLGGGDSVEDRDLDENSYKRKHIKLNTDYQILQNNHQQLKSKLDEIQPIYSSNLFDLQKLNNIIKQQSATIEESQRSLSEQEDWKLKFNDLSGKYQALEERFQELSESRSKGFNETHSDVKQLSTGLDAFLSKYITTDPEGESKTRDLNDSIGSTGQGDVTSSLQKHIDDLLKENEDLHTQHKSLQNKYTTLESSQSELEALRAKVSELSKIEENYKDSLHSVRNTSRALQVSQSELAKQKEVTLKLQQELDELKLFRANRKSSRNTTPIVNEYTKTETPKQNVTTTDDEEEDIENAHYNLKIRDLQAESFIYKQERDELKQEILELKKKLLNSQPGSSY